MSRPLRKSLSQEAVIAGSIPEPNSGCWLWEGALFWDGYGQFNYKSGGAWVKARAHRIAYELFKGEPGALFVCHRCDTPSCVNPDHLFLGTPDDNMKDAKRKGRHVSPRFAGSEHPFAKVDEETVRKIRSYRSERGCCYRISEAMGLPYAYIKSIRGQRTWKHVR